MARPLGVVINPSEARLKRLGAPSTVDETVGRGVSFMSDPCRATKQHTPYNPSDAEWKCPKCGAGVNDLDGFFIEESGKGKTDDCGNLHKDDLLVCSRCGHGMTGARFAAACAKAANKVPCPTCKGHGVVDGPRPAQGVE